MKKSLTIINICLILAILIGDIAFIISQGIEIKSATSICFFALGFINLIFALKNNTIYKKFAIIIVVGLFFAMLGDIFLEIEFIAGAILFAIGHIFYFVSYCYITRFKPKDLLYGFIIIIPSALFILFAPFFNFNPSIMQVLCIIYSIIISFMVGKSISNYIQNKTLLTFIILLGSGLFFFSDLMLLLARFGGVVEIGRFLCLATYYPAEILLAMGILFENKQR